jgi:hypothetical protein
MMLSNIFFSPIDNTSILMYAFRMVLKIKGQRNNQIATEALAMLVMGLWDGSRLSTLDVPSRGFNSLQVQLINRHPASSGNYSRGTSSGRSQKDGVSRPAVIFALGTEESKGENDLPQLPNRMQEIWEDAEGSATVSLLSMLQNVFRSS